MCCKIDNLMKKMKNFQCCNKYFKVIPELASHSPLGENFTDDTALVCPVSVYFRV